MSRQQHVPSGKLIDIDDDDDDVGSDFEELNLLLEGDDDRIATNQSSSAKSSPLATPSANKHVSTRTTNEPPKPEQVSFRDRFDDDNFDDHEHDVPTFDVSFSSATFANSNSKTKSPAKSTGSRWSQSASVGGTVLNNPAFQSDFNADYLLWSKVTAQQKRLNSYSSAYSLTSSIVNLISNGSGGSKLDNSAILTGQTKSSKFSLDSLLTSKGGGGGAEQKLLPPSSSSQTTTTQSPKMTSSSSNSKYRPTEWSMSSLNSANSNSSVERVDRRTSAYGETQRLVDQGSATRLIQVNDNNDDDYDSADGFGGFHRRSMINGGGDDDDMGAGKVNGSGGPCSNWSLYKGIFYSSLSSVFFSLSAVIVKYLKVSVCFLILGIRPILLLKILSTAPLAT